MDNKYQILSLCMSAIALAVATATGFFQYQARQDAVEERVKVELKMAIDNSPLNSLDLRMISGVEEREQLEAVLLVTNIGNTSVRLLEAGYQGLDLPIHGFYASAEKERVLTSGEQAVFAIPDLVKIHRQLTDDIILGAEDRAKIFAVTTKGKRFEAPAIIEVAK